MLPLTFSLSSDSSRGAAAERRKAGRSRRLWHCIVQGRTIGWTRASGNSSFSPLRNGRVLVARSGDEPEFLEGRCADACGMVTRIVLWIFFSPFFHCGEDCAGNVSFCIFSPSKVVRMDFLKM